MVPVDVVTGRVCTAGVLEEAKGLCAVLLDAPLRDGAAVGRADLADGVALDRLDEACSSASTAGTADVDRDLVDGRVAVLST